MTEVHQNNDRTRAKNQFIRGDQLLAELGNLLKQLENSRLSVRRKMDCALNATSKKRSNPAFVSQHHY